MTLLSLGMNEKQQRKWDECVASARENVVDYPYASVWAATVVAVADGVRGLEAHCADLAAAGDNITASFKAEVASHVTAGQEKDTRIRQLEAAFRVTDRDAIHNEAALTLDLAEGLAADRLAYQHKVESLIVAARDERAADYMAREADERKDARIRWLEAQVAEVAWDRDTRINQLAAVTQDRDAGNENEARVLGRMLQLENQLTAMTRDRDERVRHIGQLEAQLAAMTRDRDERVRSAFALAAATHASKEDQEVIGEIVEAVTQAWWEGKHGISLGDLRGLLKIIH